VNHTDKFLLVIQRLVRDTGLDESRIITLLSNNSVALLAVNHTDKFLFIAKGLLEKLFSVNQVKLLMQQKYVSTVAMSEEDKFLRVVQTMFDQLREPSDITIGNRLRLPTAICNRMLEGESAFLRIMSMESAGPAAAGILFDVRRERAAVDSSIPLFATAGTARIPPLCISACHLS
jgi:hypothetical protein